MTARIIDGNALSAQVRGEIAERAAALTARGVQPCLAVMLVGADPASAVYVRNKGKMTAAAGMARRAPTPPRMFVPATTEPNATAWCISIVDAVMGGANR